MSYLSLTSLREYFECENFSQELSLDISSGLRYHWADHATVGNAYRNRLTENKRMQERWKRHHNELNAHKDTVVWLSGKQGQVRTDLYEIYKSYFDKILGSWLIDRSNLLISTDTEAGPYMPLSSLRWFDLDDARNHMIIKLLSGNKTFREFRLRCQIPATIYADEDGFENYPLTISQITDYGLLLKMSSVDPFNKPGVGNEFILKFGIGDLADMVPMPSIELQKELMKTDLQKNCFAKKEEIYIFSRSDVLESVASIGKGDKCFFIPYSSLVPMESNAHSLICLKVLREKIKYALEKNWGVA